MHIPGWAQARWHRDGTGCQSRMLRPLFAHFKDRRGAPGISYMWGSKLLLTGAKGRLSSFHLALIAEEELLCDDEDEDGRIMYI